MESRLIVNPIITKKKGKGGGSHKKGQGMMTTTTMTGTGTVTTGHCQSDGSLMAANCNSNTREREKTQSVNTAYTTLRTLIPTEPADRKLSKIETLRLASSYISHLSSHLLEENFHGENEGGQQIEGQSSRSRICTFCLSESKKLRSNILPQPLAPQSTVTTIQSSYCQLPPLPPNINNNNNHHHHLSSDDFYEDYHHHHTAIMFNPPHHHQLNHSNNNNNNLQIYY